MYYFRFIDVEVNTYLTLNIQVPNNKAIEYRTWETPYLRRIKQRYGKPGDMITFYGRMFTKEYGNMNWRDNEGGSSFFQISAL